MVVTKPTLGQGTHRVGDQTHQAVQWHSALLPYTERQNLQNQRGQNKWQLFLEAPLLLPSESFPSPGSLQPSAPADPAAVLQCPLWEPQGRRAQAPGLAG